MSQVKMNKNRRSAAYRFTITSKNDPDLKQLRKIIAAENVWARKYPRYNKVQRVRVVGRGPRTAPANKDFGKRKDGRAQTSYQAWLPHRHATHFDVYVSDI